MNAPKPRAYSRETVVAEKLEDLVELGMLNTRFKDYFDLHFLAYKFTFANAALSISIATTFKRGGTSLPHGLPVGLTLAFSQDPAKIRGWEAFCRKTVSKAAVPALEEIVERLVEFLELPLAAAAKGEKLGKEWRSNRWTEE
jgi:hypothetical protein